jgi:hypothetical protein
MDFGLLPHYVKERYQIHSYVQAANCRVRFNASPALS